MAKINLRIVVAALAAASLPVLAQPSPPGLDQSQSQQRVEAPQGVDAPQAPAARSALEGARTAVADFLTRRDAGQWLASDCIGATAFDAAGDEIGEVDELVLDQNGSVVALVVGVAGFLAVGEKDIAIPYQAVTLGTLNGNVYVQTKYAKADLENAPAFLRDAAGPGPGEPEAGDKDPGR